VACSTIGSISPTPRARRGMSCREPRGLAARTGHGWLASSGAEPAKGGGREAIQRLDQGFGLVELATIGVGGGQPVVPGFPASLSALRPRPARDKLTEGCSLAGRRADPQASAASRAGPAGAPRHQGGRAVSCTWLGRPRRAPTMAQISRGTPPVLPHQDPGMGSARWCPSANYTVPCNGARRLARTNPNVTTTRRVRYGRYPASAWAQSTWRD